MDEMKMDKGQIKGRHKELMRKRFDHIYEGEGEVCTPLKATYSDLWITEGDVTREEDRWVLRTPCTGSLSCSEILKCLMESNKSRTVMMTGVAGTGKTVCLQKFILDWAEGVANQDVDFIFALPFRQLNLISNHSYNLCELLLYFHPELKGIVNPSMSDQFKILLIFDGMDEGRLPLDVEKNMGHPMNTVSVDVLITNLLKGNLLPNAHIWITSRPEAENKIPLQYIHKRTKVEGFRDPEMYIKRKIQDPTAAKNVVYYVRRSRSLYTMCNIPVFCWILTTVLSTMLKDDCDLPQSLTEFYIHFVIITTMRKRKRKYAEKNSALATNREAILKLSELAYKQLEKGNIFFDEDCGNPSLYPEICNGFLKSDTVNCNRTKVFSFVHRSVQEFLAALFAFHSFMNNNTECLKPFLSDEVSNDQADVLINVVDNVLQRKTGYLDHFPQFLLGLFVESNQMLLKGLLQGLPKTSNSDSIKKTVQHIKNNLFQETESLERCKNLSVLLLELKDNSLYKEIENYVSQGKYLLPLHSSALAHFLLMSDENLDEFDLTKYNIGNEGRKRLLVILEVCKQARLVNCGLREDSCVIIASALQLEKSQLIELNLSGNPLTDSGVRKLCDGLKHSKLKNLSLADCELTSSACKMLASVMLSKCSLELLDLTENKLTDTGVKEFRPALKDMHCTLKVLRLSGCCISQRGCEFIVRALASNPEPNLTELDLSYNNLCDEGLQILSQLPANLKVKTEGATLPEYLIRSDSLESAQTTKLKWICHSKRWQPRLQELTQSVNTVNMGSLIFHKEFIIGPGSNGTNIFLGLMVDGTEVAIKRVEKSKFERVQGDRIPQELKLVSPNIVHYKDFIEDDEYVYIALQLCEYSLDDYLKETKPDNKALKKLAKEVLEGLQVLHENGVIHRDIKPQNVLIDVSGQALLADFGLSRRLDRNQTTLSTDRAGTQYWEAAEILYLYETEDCERQNRHVKYKKSSDIQVAGMLLYYILTMGKHHPFGKNPYDPRCPCNILDGKPSLENITDDEAKDVIGWMIKRDPTERPRVQQCLEHPYFSGRRWSSSNDPGVNQSKCPTVQSEASPSVSKTAGGSAPTKDDKTGSAPTKEDKTGQEFFTKHKWTLEERLPDILHPILSRLEQNKVLKRQEREQMQIMPSSQERNHTLITIIGKRGAKAQQVFYEVLKDEDPYLVEDLESS